MSNFFDNLLSSDNKISQNKTHKMDCAPSLDLEQTGHQSCQICTQWIGSIQVNKDRQMAYNPQLQEHRSVTKKCFISALNSAHLALLHLYTTYL